MAVFIELVTDAFTSVFRNQVSARQNPDGGRAARAGKTVARRPLRGIEIKDDTYANLKVVMSNGQEWPLLDSSSADGKTKRGYTNFILQNVAEQRMEKHQIVETFGDSYIFFFGESPRFLNCTAILVNTLDFNWRAEWWHNYENYLRGTKLVELGARCYMFWDDIVIEGYMLNSVCSEQSERPYIVTLQFKFFVTKYENVSLNNVEQYPVRSSVLLPPGVELTDADAFTRLQSFYRGESAGERGEAAVPREQEVISNSLRQEPAPANKISQKLRQLPDSLVVDPAIWNQLTGVIGIADTDQDIVNKFIGQRNGLRGLIAENVDEYTSGTPVTVGVPALRGETDEASGRPDIPDSLATSSIEEVDDLGTDAIRSLEAVGANADNPNTLRDIGLGPNFSPGFRRNSAAGAFGGAGGFVGASTSFGGTASAGVSFGVLGNASVSGFAGAGAFAEASAGVTSELFVDDSFGRRDPLLSIYGRTDSDVNEFSPQRRQFVEGAGDYGYGYRSAYGGVGYGIAGYGDFGGTGFGSSNGLGDPGYIDPEEFSFNLVGDNQSEFSTWKRPRRDNTAVTRGHVFAGRGATSTASIDVRGTQTAFSTVVLEGTLSSWITAASENDGVVVEVGGQIRGRAAADSHFIVGPGQAL